MSSHGGFVLPREQSTTPAAGTSVDAHRTERSMLKKDDMSFPQL